MNDDKKPTRTSKKPSQLLFDALVELLKVRSMITIAIIGVMSYLAIKQIIDAATFMTLAGAVVTYYFNRREAP